MDMNLNIIFGNIQIVFQLVVFLLSDIACFIFIVLQETSYQVMVVYRVLLSKCLNGMISCAKNISKDLISHLRLLVTYTGIYVNTCLLRSCEVYLNFYFKFITCTIILITPRNT
jgi:hypothetical protein